MVPTKEKTKRTTPIAPGPVRPATPVSASEGRSGSRPRSLLSRAGPARDPGLGMRRPVSCLRSAPAPVLRFVPLLAIFGLLSTTGAATCQTLLSRFFQ